MSSHAICSPALKTLVLVLLAALASACGKTGSPALYTAVTVPDNTVTPTSNTASAAVGGVGDQSTPPPVTTSSSVTDNGITSDSNGVNDDSNTNAVTRPIFFFGDPNRYPYVFFAKQDIGLGTSGDAPVMGLVFTADPNFCTRTAAPMFVSDFVVYQLPFVQNDSMNTRPLNFASTYPDLHAHLSGIDASHFDGYYDIGFTSVCDIESGTGYATVIPSWNIWTSDGGPIDTSEVVNYNFSATNETGVVTFVGSAKRCNAAVTYFGIHAGNHPVNAQIPCVRTTVASP